MSPGRGDGANVAMQDACLLSEALAGAVSGRTAPAEAIARYESDMLRYGFQAVADSLRTFGPAAMFEN